MIGSTEHAAAQLLPHLADRARAARSPTTGSGSASTAARSCATGLGRRPDRPRPAARARRRPARGPGRRAGAHLVLGARLDAAGSGQPIPLVAFDEPCALRTRALETLPQHGIPAVDRRRGDPARRRPGRGRRRARGRPDGDARPDPGGAASRATTCPPPARCPWPSGPVPAWPPRSPTPRPTPCNSCSSDPSP